MPSRQRVDMSIARLERAPYRRFALPGRVGRWQRIRLAPIAWWRAASLDHELAAGTDPGTSALLALRAQRISGRRCRVRVADGLARVMRDAQARSAGFSAAVRPDRREVLAARTVLAALDRRLRAPEPVTPRGVALLEELLTDGASQLYRPTEPGALGSGLRAAAAALEPSDRRDRAPSTADARQEALE